MIEDTRSEKLGGINIALEIFNSSIVPAVLHNSETWINIPWKTLKTLTKFFNSFYQCIFRCCTGTPSANYYWQTASLRVENIILQKKLMFYHHLSNLPVESLAGELFHLQLSRNIEGIVTEMSAHIKKIGIHNPSNISKNIWKRKVDDYITDKNVNDILEDVRRYKKLDFEELSKERFERKSYFLDSTLENARMIFKIKSKVVPSIRKNFPNKYKNKSLSCQSCKNLNIDSSSPPEDTQNHVAFECPVFEYLRIQKDMRKDKDLAEFFAEVIKHRLEEDE